MELLNALSVPRALTLFQTSAVPAQCTASDVVGNCVHISGPMVGDLYQVATVDPLDGGTIPSVGLIISKESATLCQVQVFGITDVVSGLVPGKAYFIGTSGTLVLNPPAAPVAGIAYIQPMGTAMDSDRFLVNPSHSIIKRVG